MKRKIILIFSLSLSDTEAINYQLSFLDRHLKKKYLFTLKFQILVLVYF